jgi:hypothetical protein
MKRSSSIRSIRIFLRKYSLIFLLLFAFSYDFAGFGLAVKIRQLMIQREMKAQFRKDVDESQLFAISLNDALAAGVHWKEKGREFEMNGRMFDVIRTKTSGHCLMLFCINDKKEQQLLAHFFSKQMQQKNQRKFGKINFQKFGPQELCVSFISGACSDLYRCYAPSAYCSPAPEIPSPPPDSVV